MEKEPTVLVFGNKNDQEESRKVPLMNAAKLCQEKNYLFAEGSAITGEGINELFNMLIKKIFNNVESGKLLGRFKNDFQRENWTNRNITEKLWILYFDPRKRARKTKK